MVRLVLFATRCALHRRGMIATDLCARVSLGALAQDLLRRYQRNLTISSDVFRLRVDQQHRTGRV